MPTFNYYLDSNSFTTATAIYTDADLTTKAPDGLYQNCGVYRYQYDGFLQDPTTCPFCNVTECGSGKPIRWITDTQGYYQFDVELGTTTGMWIVKFAPQNIPNGIIVNWSGTDYTGGSSDVYGYLAGPYFGNNTQITAYNFPNASPYFVNKMAWDGQTNGFGEGTNFVPTGATETVSIVPADVSGTAAAPGFIHLFIPKNAAEPQTATITCIGPVGGGNDSFTLQGNDCPVTLLGFTVSGGPQPDAVTACAAPVINTYYNGPVTGTLGEPGLYDVMFANSAGTTTLADALGAGFYGYSSGGVPTGYFEIDVNSVITQIGTCPP